MEISLSCRKIRRGNFLADVYSACYYVRFRAYGSGIALGRKTGASAINAFKKLNKKWAFLGVLCAIIPIIILPYYSVIGGWVGKYFITFLSGNGHAAAGDNYFNNFIASPWQPLLFFAIFITIAFVIVLSE